MSAIAFSRLIGPVPINVAISEKHDSELEITQLPVERGADITDHAFRQPDKITLSIASDGAAATWNALKAFQRSRVPFTVVSGLQLYRNMLIRHMSAERHKDNGNILEASVDLQEVIIVGTAAAPANQQRGGAPGGVNATRAARPAPEISRDAITADRAASTVARGDNVAQSVPIPQARDALRDLRF